MGLFSKKSPEEKEREMIAASMQMAESKFKIRITAKSAMIHDELYQKNHSGQISYEEFEEKSQMLKQWETESENNFKAKLNAATTFSEFKQIESTMDSFISTLVDELRQKLN